MTALMGLSLAASGVMLIVAFLAAAISWMMWIHLAYSNLTERFGLHADNSANAAAFSYLVPFVNFVLPFRTTRELYEKTAPVGTDGSTLLNVWWACWIATGLVSRLDKDGEMFIVSLMSLGLLIASGVAAYILIDRLTTFQIELDARSEQTANVFW